MATMDLLFDPSAYQYPEYPRDLKHLTEEVTLSNFILPFKRLNWRYKFTSEQLRVCWLHALNQEHQKIMSGEAHMKKGQVETAEKSMSQGIERLNANIFPWHDANQGDAEYDPNLKARKVGSNQQDKGHKRRLRGELQDFDPLLLLQSIPEIRLQAERFYQDGFPKFLDRRLGALDTRVLENYMYSCVFKAEQYIKCLLKDKYRKDVHKGGRQISQYEERLMYPSPQSHWKNNPKWVPIWSRMKAARKQIVSELGGDPMTEQDVTMDAKSSSNQIENSRVSETSAFFRAVNTTKYRDVLYRLRNERRFQQSWTPEDRKDSIRSKKLAEKHAKLARGKLRCTGLEASLESFSFNPAEKPSAPRKRKGRQDKMARRIERETENEFHTRMEGVLLTGNSSFNNASQFTFSIEDSGTIGPSVKRQRLRREIGSIHSSNSTATKNLPQPDTVSGSTLSTSKVPEGMETKVQNHAMLMRSQARESFVGSGIPKTIPIPLLKVAPAAGRTDTAATTVKAETQDVPYLKTEQIDDELYQMDFEMSESIAKLNIKR